MPVQDLPPTDPAVLELLQQPREAVLGVNRQGKAPQLSVVWFRWDGEQFLVSTLQGRAKHTNLSRDPACTILINDPTQKWYLMAYGKARFFREGHEELSRDLHTRYLPGADPGTSPTDPERVVLALRPERMITGR